MVRVVMIDDNDLVRNTLRETIGRYRDIEVVGEADCGEAGLEVVARTSPRDADGVPKRQDPPEEGGESPRRDTGTRCVGRLRDEFAGDPES
jgi:hypothetical protein